MKEIKITHSEANQRLDKFLLKYLNKAPKSFVYKMLRKKNIKLNNNRAEGSEILKELDIITLFLSDDTIDNFCHERIIKKPRGSIEIIYEDENLLMINKPVGLLSQPEKASDNDSLIDRILYYLHEKDEFSSDKYSTFTPALCNRLDRNTSGIVVCGKNLHALQAANKMFAENGIEKYYRTIVVGKIKEGGILKDFYIKDLNKNMGVITKDYDSNSKEIVTCYEPVKTNSGFTLLDIKLITGKSHQIRLHLSSIKHPIIGDTKYGDKSTNLYVKKEYGISNQVLHCYKIIMKENNGILKYLYNREFTTKIPQIFNTVMNDNMNYK